MGCKYGVPVDETAAWFFGCPIGNNINLFVGNKKY